MLPTRPRSTASCARRLPIPSDLSSWLLRRAAKVHRAGERQMFPL